MTTRRPCLFGLAAAAEFLLLSATASAETARERACRQVERDTEHLARSLPKMLDRETMGVAATAIGCDVKMRFKFPNYRKAELPADIVAKLKARAVPGLCSDPTTKPLFEYDGSVEMTYLDGEDVFVGRFTVKRPDCRGR